MKTSDGRKFIRISTVLSFVLILALSMWSVLVPSSANAVVGGASDYKASTPGVFSSVSGTFTGETNYNNEYDTVYGPEAYSLQLNTNFIQSCHIQGVSQTWSGCWVQVIYATVTDWPWRSNKLYAEFSVNAQSGLICPPTVNPIFQITSGRCYAEVDFASGAHDPPQYLYQSALYLAVSSSTINAQYCGHNNNNPCLSGSVTNIFGTDLVNNWNTIEFNVFGFGTSGAGIGTAYFVPTPGRQFGLGVSVVITNSASLLSCITGSYDTSENSNLHLGSGSCVPPNSYTMTFTEQTAETVPCHGQGGGCIGDNLASWTHPPAPYTLECYIGGNNCNGDQNDYTNGGGSGNGYSLLGANPNFYGGVWVKAKSFQQLTFNWGTSGVNTTFIGLYIDTPPGNSQTGYEDEYTAFAITVWDANTGRLWQTMVGLEANPNSPYYGQIFWYNNQTQVWGPYVSTFWNSWQPFTMTIHFGWAAGHVYYGPLSFDFVYGNPNPVTRTGITPTLYHQSPGGYSYIAYTAQVVNAYPNPPSQQTFGWGDFSDWVIQQY